MTNASRLAEDAGRPARRLPSCAFTRILRIIAMNIRQRPMSPVRYEVPVLETAERVDVHAHFVFTPAPFAERFGDDRWPSVAFDGDHALLSRGGRVVRRLPPAGWSLTARIDALDAAALDRQVLSPVPPLICDWAGPELAAEWARHANRELANAVAAHPSRFTAMGTVPLNHPGVAVAVLEEAKQLGLVGVEIGTTAGGRELDHPDLLEFFQAAGELGMVVFIHPLVLGAHSDWTPRIDTLELTFGLGMTTDTAIAAARLVFGGTVSSSPGLSLCLAHGGGSFAWVLARIAHLWDRTHDTTAAELARPVYVDSVVFDQRNLRFLVDQLGADRVLFGTDHPLPGGDSLRGDTIAGLSADEYKLVAGGNFRDILARSPA